MKRTKIFTLIAALMLMIAGAATACANSNAKASEAPAATAPMTPDSDTAIRPGMKPKKLTVIDFNATWCGPCRMFAPAFDKAAEEYGSKVDFYSIDTDKYAATAQAFQIQAIPTIIIIEPDGQTTTFVGLNDFFDGISESASQQQVVDGMARNLCSIIAAKLPK